MPTTQTTSGMSMVDVKLEITSDGTTWNDVSGHATSIKAEPGKRKIGATYTAKGDVPIVTAGKREESKVTVSTVYTEGASPEPFALVWAAFQAGTKTVGVRWQPKTGVGSNVFTVQPGYIESCEPPQGDVEKGEALVFEWTLIGADILKSASAS